VRGGEGGRIGRQEAPENDGGGADRGGVRRARPFASSTADSRAGQPRSRSAGARAAAGRLAAAPPPGPRHPTPSRAGPRAPAPKRPAARGRRRWLPGNSRPCSHDSRPSSDALP
jgi:hypothetical protein